MKLPQGGWVNRVIYVITRSYNNIILWGSNFFKLIHNIYNNISSIPNVKKPVTHLNYVYNMFF